MLSPISLVFLFLSFAVSASATSRPCASQPIRHASVVPSRNPHFSRPSLHLTLHDLVKSRQAVAPPPVFYQTQRRKDGLSKSLNKLKKLKWELGGVRDEMGRLASRVQKLGKRGVSSDSQDGTGQEIHDLLYQLLDYYQSPSASTSTRTVHDEDNFVIKPRRNHADSLPSASPVPSGRAKRSYSVDAPATVPVADLKRTLSSVLETFSSTLALATTSVSSLPSSSQRTSIQALISELRWEMSTLLADTQYSVPELILSNETY